MQACISTLYGSENSEQPGKAQFAPATPSPLIVRQPDASQSKWSGYANVVLFLLLQFGRTPGKEVFIQSASLCDRAGIERKTNWA